MATSAITMSVNSGGNPTNVNNMLMRNRQNSSKFKLEDLKSTTDLTKVPFETKMDLYQQFDNYIKSSKINNDFKPIVSNMISTIKNLAKHVKEQQEKCKQHQHVNLNPIQNYTSYSNCVQNKVERFPVIIKIKDIELNENDENYERNKQIADSLKSIDLKKTSFSSLKTVKSQIDLLSLKKTKDKIIMNFKDSKQQDIVIDQLNNVTGIQAVKPRVKIPSILISEIEREDGFNSNDDIKNYLMNELSQTEQIDKSSFDIKLILNSPKRHTIGCIVNFDEKTTKTIVQRGFVKVNFKICPIERTCKIVQCARCFKFGHFEKDLRGNITCKCPDQKCKFCGDDHSDSSCHKDKSNSANLCCVNCGENHSATYRKCKTRIEVMNKLLSRCSC